MFTAINHLFTALATLFSACNRGASAINHCARWAEQEASDFGARAELERTARIEQLRTQLKALPLIPA